MGWEGGLRPGWAGEDARLLTGTRPTRRQGPVQLLFPSPVPRYRSYCIHGIFIYWPLSI